MPLETASTIADLVASNPAASDPLTDGDDHIRLLKAVLQNTFPGLTAGEALLRSPGGIIIPGDGTSTAPGYSFASEPTLGFYRSKAGIITLAGGTLRGKGAIPIGSTHMFLIAPATLGTAGTGTGWEYLELDGSTWNIADFPDLAAAFGVTTGTTFTLPNMVTTGRFPRARRSGITAGTAEPNTVGPHTHPDFAGTTAIELQAHEHTFSGTTTGMDRAQSHAHTYTGYDGGSVNAGGGVGGQTGGTHTTDATNIDHLHTFSGATGPQAQNHNHTFTSSTPANTGTTETRPEALSFIFAVKT